MPQLNPTPWFVILLVTWIIFILLSPQKLTGYLFFGSPNTKLKIHTKQPWSWPWF